MAVKTKSEMQNMTNDQLVAYLNGLSKSDFNGYIDADTKVRYFIYIYGDGIAKAIKGTQLSVTFSRYSISEYPIKAKPDNKSNNQKK
jgi:hypothetical protein